MAANNVGEISLVILTEVPLGKAILQAIEVALARVLITLAVGLISTKLEESSAELELFNSLATVPEEGSKPSFRKVPSLERKVLYLILFCKHHSSTEIPLLIWVLYISSHSLCMAALSRINYSFGKTCVILEGLLFDYKPLVAVTLTNL